MSVGPLPLCLVFHLLEVDLVLIVRGAVNVVGLHAVLLKQVQHLLQPVVIDVLQRRCPVAQLHPLIEGPDGPARCARTHVAALLGLVEPDVLLLGVAALQLGVDLQQHAVQFAQCLVGHLHQLRQAQAVHGGKQTGESLGVVGIHPPHDLRLGQHLGERLVRLPALQVHGQFHLQRPLGHLAVVDVDIHVDGSLLTDACEHLSPQLTDHLHVFGHDAHQSVFLPRMGPFFAETGKLFKQSGEYCIEVHKSFVILCFSPS